MPLTPIDIQQKTFGPELRGYNMDEVDDFLDEVVTALKDYDQRVRDAQDRIRALEAELSTRGEDESAISRALVGAQKQADTLVSDAHSDAERIRADAQVEADQLRADRDTERMSLTQDIARMRATVADLKRRLIELAAAAGDDFDAMDEAAAAASVAVGGDLAVAVDADFAADVASAPGYDDAAVGDGLDVFDSPGVEADLPEEADKDAIEAAEDWQADKDESEVSGDTVESEDDADADEWADAVEVDDEVEDADVEDSDIEGDNRSGQHLSAELEDVVEDIDDDAGVEAPPPGRRPWERGSV